MGKDKDKIRKLIWRAIHNHFSLKDHTRLETDIRHEKNKTIAQIVAIGLCAQYRIDRADVENTLCIESIGYDNKLKAFKKLAHQMNMSGRQSEEVQDFARRYAMCSRFVRRRLEYTYNA